MKRFIPIGICLLGCAIFAISNQLENALGVDCVQGCNDGVPDFCYTDAMGKCKTNQCFFYYFGNDVTQYAGNCFVCGGPGAGWCVVGDNTKKCNVTNKAVNWDFTDSCEASCSNPNTIVQTSGGGMTVSSGSGFLFLCTGSY